MSVIEVNGRVFKKYKLVTEFVAKNVIKFMGFPDNLEVAIDFVSEKAIKKLNHDFRDIDKVTDVLSFPAFELQAGEEFDVEFAENERLKNENGLFHFGDIAICFKQMKRQAKEYGVTVELELKKLVIHSMLHLMGYDHIKDEDYLIMKEQEEKLDKLI